MAPAFCGGVERAPQARLFVDSTEGVSFHMTTEFPRNHVVRKKTRKKNQSEQQQSQDKYSSFCPDSALACPLLLMNPGMQKGRQTDAKRGDTNGLPCPSDLLYVSIQRLSLVSVLHLLRHHGADPFHQPLFIAKHDVGSAAPGSPSTKDRGESNGHDSLMPAHDLCSQGYLASAMQMAARLAAFLRSPVGGAYSPDLSHRAATGSVFPPVDTQGSQTFTFSCLYTWGAPASSQLGYPLFSAAAEKRVQKPKAILFCADSLSNTADQYVAKKCMPRPGESADLPDHLTAEICGSRRGRVSRKCDYCVMVSQQVENRENSSVRLQLVRCGPTMSLAATVDGQVWVWGRGADGGRHVVTEPALVAGLFGMPSALEINLHATSVRRPSLPGEKRTSTPEALGFEDEASLKKPWILHDSHAGAETDAVFVSLDSGQGKSRVPPAGVEDGRPAPGFQTKTDITSGPCGCRCSDRMSFGSFIRGAAVGAQHCLLLAEVLVGERFHDDPPRSRRPARRLQKGGKRKCLEENLGGCLLPRELESLSFSPLAEEGDGCNSSNPASSGEDAGAPLPGRPSCRGRTGAGNCEYGCYIFRIESRVYGWGSNARQQLGIPHGSQKAAQFRVGRGVETAETTQPNGRSRDFSSPSTFGPQGSCKGSRSSGTGKVTAKSTKHITPEEWDQVCAYRPLLLSRWISAPCESRSVSCGVETSDSQSAPFPEWAVGISSEGHPMACKCPEPACTTRRSCSVESSCCVSFAACKDAAGVVNLYEPFFRFSSKVKAVAAGLHHSMLLGENGDVWVFGDNTFGQCAEPPLVSKVAPPRRLVQLPCCCAIVAGHNTSMAISLPPQSVFIWGGSAVPGHQLTAYATQPRPQSASALAPFTGVKDRDSRTCAAESTTLSFPVSTVSDTLLMECGDDGTPAFGNATGKSVVIPEAASVAPTRPSSASRPSCGAAASPDCCSSAADYRPYLAFFSPLRLKGLAAGDRGEAHADGDWVTQTAARSCPVLVKESLVVNDKVGLAVGADGRLRLWFCSERPCLVRPALALYSPYPVPFSGFCTPVCSPTSPAPSPEDGSSDPGRSSSVPGSLVGGTRLEYRIWPRPLPYPLLHLQGASSAWPGAGGIKQLALSSSRCFLLTSEGLLYSSFLPHAVSPSTPSPERCPSVSSPGKHSLSSSASPFSPGGTSERAKPTGVDAGGTCGNPVTSLRCPVSPCFLGGRNRDTREAPTATAPRPPHTTALSQLRFSSNASSSFVNSSSHSPSCPHFRGHAGYPWTVYLVFSPVRDICNISSFSCSDSHTAAIVDTHAPAFRLSSAPEPSGCFSSNRSSTHTGPPSLGACAAQAILRSSRGLPPSPSFVLDVLAPLSVSVRNSSLFDFCCLYLLFNLPLLLSFPLASDAVSRLVKRAILLPQGDLMPLTGTDSYLPASAGMQYLLRALKAALTTASLGAETLESWLSLASTLFFFDRVVSEPSDCGRRVAVHRTEEVASVVSTGHTDANKENQSIVKNDSNHTRSRPEVCRSADDSPPSASRRRSESGTRQQEMELLDLRTGCAVQQREALSDSAAAPEQMQTRTAYGTDSRTHLCAEGERDVRLARTLDCATLPKMSRKEEGRSTPAILHESDSFSRSGAALLSGTDRAAKDTFAREEGAEALQLWEELEQMWFPNSRVLRPALASAAMELSTLLRGKLESPTFSLQSDLLDENTSSALSLRGSAGGEHARPRFGEEPYAGSVSSSEDGLACTSLFAPAEKGPILLLVLPRRASDLLMADGRLRRERRLLLDKWTRAYWATEDEEPGAVVRKARGLEKTAQTGKQEKHGKEFFAEATCVSVADAEGSSCGQGENGGKEEEKTLGQHRGQRPTGKSKGNTIDRDASGRNGRCLDSCETEPPVHQDEEKTFRSLPECVEISRAGADNKSTTESVRAAPCVRADRFLVPMRDTDYAVGCSDSRLSRASHVTEGNGGTSGNTRGGVSSRHRAGFLEASCGPFPVAAADGTGIRGTPLVGHSRMRPSHASASGDISGDSPCSGVASWSPCSSLVSGVETVQEVSVLGGSEVKETGELRTTRDASALSATGTNHTEEWTEEEKQTGFSWQKVKHRKKRVEAASERELVGDGTATRQNTITGSPVEMHSYTKEIRSQESPATRASKEKKNESHRPDQAATDVGKSPWIRLPKSARNSRTACTSPVMMWGPSKDSPFQSPSILPPCSSRPSSSFASSEGNSDVPRDVRSVFRLCDFLVTTGTKKKSRKGSALEVTSRASPFSGEEGTSAWRPGTHGTWKTVKENCIAGDTANTAGEEKLSTDLASVMQEEEALHEAKQLKLRLLQEQEQAHEASSVVRSPGLPSIVFVPRQSAAGGFTSCGRGRAVVHRNQARGGSAGRLLANCRDHTASFNCWGKEAALRAQGEESLVTDLKIIQMQQSREHEEEQVRLREEAEVQEALRLVDEMEKREREAARQLKREMDRAAAKERSRAQRQTRGGSRGSRWTGRTYGPGE